MQKALYLLGRFDIDAGPALHFSATAAVVAATDHADKAKPRRALKAMRKADQVLAELEGRKGLDRKYVIAVVGVFVDTAVDKAEYAQLELAAKALSITIERSKGLEKRLGAELAKEVHGPKGAADEGSGGSDAGVAERKLQRSKSDFRRTMGYRFLLALELGDRSLFETISHEHIVGHDFFAVRKIAADLASALGHLHKKGRIHADLKPLNAVRIDGSWRLIDLDISCAVGRAFGAKVPTSGYCPPEMAKVLLDATNAATGDVRVAELQKYARASVAYDLWSFGVLLFELVFGHPLWLMDPAGGIATRDDLEKLTNWDRRAFNRAFKNARCA
ncbi:MAG: hypothetical protein VX475_16050, partial [Myxococcota bacterium]|nr:hypothetical protein [Myxococcota bacterium]